MGVLRRIFAITRKEIRILFTRPLERRIIIVPPIVLMLLFSFAATREVRNVDMAVLNYDQGIWSTEIIQRLQGASSLFRSITPMYDRQTLKDALDRQRILVALVFPDDFSRNLEANQVASVQVLLDGRRTTAAQLTQNYLERILADVSQQAQQRYATAPSGAGVAILHSVNWFNPNLEFRWFYLPSLIGLLTMMMGFVITGLSVAREREMGTFDQMLVSPANPTEIAIAKLIPGCLIAMVHGTIFVIGIHFFFKVPLEGSVLLLYTSLLIFALACSGVGLMISSVASSQQQAFLGCFTVAVPLILLSGYASPVSNMPAFLISLSELDPLRHFLVILQGVFLRALSWNEALPSIAKMFAIAFVSTFSAILLFRKRL